MSRSSHGEQSDKIEKVQLESQHLQLCAVHAINNLLQISNQEDAATKEELDSIADSLITAEKAIYNSSEESLENANKNRSTVGISWYDSLTNRHRTPILGNYSFEVVTLALRKRGTELSWCDAKYIENTILGKCSQHNDQTHTIGFIVNSVSPRLNYFSFGLFGRHWLSIIPNNRSRGDRDNLAIQVTHAATWTILDSNHKKPVYLDSSEALITYLKGQHKDGAAIFCAKQT